MRKHDYIVNGREFSPSDYKTTELCAFKSERLPTIFDRIRIYVVNEWKTGERWFYMWVEDAEWGTFYEVHEITAKEAAEYCKKCDVRRHYEKYKGYRGYGGLKEYERLTGFTD